MNDNLFILKLNVISVVFDQPTKLLYIQSADKKLLLQTSVQPESQPTCTMGNVPSVDQSDERVLANEI